MPVNETVESGAGFWRQEDSALGTVLFISLLTTTRNGHGSRGSSGRTLCLRGCFSRTCRAWRSVQVLAVTLCLCPEQLPPNITKSRAKRLSDHCAQEGPKSPKERPEMPSQGRSGAGSWFAAPVSDCRTRAIETEFSSDSFVCLAGRVVSHLIETALILCLTTSVLLKYSAIKRDKITLG